MTMQILLGAAGLAALAAAAPASAQHYPYGYNPYGTTYGHAPYGYSPYGYQPYQANMQQYAVSRCTSAVQARLNSRTGLAGVLGSIVGINTNNARVVTVTRIRPDRNSVMVRGLATSGRYAYNPYGYDYYGAVGGAYAAPADLSFKCDVDYHGRIRDIDINRRR